MIVVDVGRFIFLRGTGVSLHLIDHWSVYLKQIFFVDIEFI